MLPPCRPRVGTTGALNLMGYSNPEVDECYTKANLTNNQDERAAYFKQAQKLLSEDLPIVPLTEVVVTEVSASYLQEHASQRSQPLHHRSVPHH